MVRRHKIAALALFLRPASGPELIAHRYPKVSFDAFASAVVVPAKVESSSDLALPDALAEKLARMGFTTAAPSTPRCTCLCGVGRWTMYSPAARCCGTPLQQPGR